MRPSKKHWLGMKNVLTDSNHHIFKTRIYILYRTKNFYWKNTHFKSAFWSWFCSDFEPSISYKLQNWFLIFLQSQRNIDASISNSSLGSYGNTTKSLKDCKQDLEFIFHFWRVYGFIRSVDMGSIILLQIGNLGIKKLKKC